MQSFIYVIAARPEGPVKIGFSVDPARRLRQLQTGHAEPLHLYHQEAFALPRAKLMERLVHNALRPHRVKGEWFRLDVTAAVAEVTYMVLRYADEPNLHRFL